MNDFVLDDIEVASPSVVRRAARDFAAALTETEQFKAFAQAAQVFEQDHAAQTAMQAYQSKQQSLKALLMLNALGDAEKSELESLRQSFNTQPSVVAYLKAQDELTLLARDCAYLLSLATMLNYSASCGASCCG